jgi:hypothetical protein
MVDMIRCAVVVHGRLGKVFEGEFGEMEKSKRNKQRPLVTIARSSPA